MDEILKGILRKKMKKIKIIYEDEYLVVINKPAGVVCNRAESVKEETLQDWMESKLETINWKQETGKKEEKSNNQFSRGEHGIIRYDKLDDNSEHASFVTSKHGEFRNDKVALKSLAILSSVSNLSSEFMNRSGLVHRLDKETSGVMVLAKDPKTFVFLQNQFKERKTKKKYLALVHGEMKLKNGTINLPLKRNILNRQKFVVNVDGKMAKTEYKVLNVSSMKEKREEQKTRNKKQEAGDNEIYSLVELNILTGRTHQIRVHLNHIGFPLVSDPLYLGKRLKSDLEWCSRMFLHAKYLSFIHPKSLERMEFEGKLSEDLEESLGRLEEI